MSVVENLGAKLRQVTADRDRYREALEWISENDPDDGVVVTGRRGIFGVRARDALLNRAAPSAASGDPVARETTPPSPASEQNAPSGPGGRFGNRNAPSDGGLR